ncbi:MAG: branched-chain amino acid ABC transporter ATP-binding protein/permease, partial [Alphaproteobacteria bacterium]
MTPPTWLAHNLNRILLLAAVAWVTAGAMVGSLYDQQLLTLAGIYVLLVLGYQLIFGHAGALNLAQASFFGLGAYATAIFSTQWGLSFIATFPISILLPALVAAVVAVPILRLQSHYFALATLALSQTMLLIAVNAQGLTGGANGLAGIPPVTIAGLPIGRGLPMLVFVWLLAALGALFAWQLMRGLYGRGFAILRATPMVAATLGINGGNRRFTAFVFSAGFAGAAGALYAHTIRVVSPETLSFSVMVLCLTMTVIGGRLQVPGALFGALLLTHLPEWFRPLQEFSLVANGGVLLAAILFAPVGIAGLATGLSKRPQANPTTTFSTTPPPPPATEMQLRVTNLSKKYGAVIALQNVSFDITAGEIVGLIGPNGSGKTTLANLLTGLDRPNAGTIHLDGQSLTGLAPYRIARYGLARSFQTPQMPPDLSVLDTIALARSNVGNASPVQALTEFGHATALTRARAAARGHLAHHGLADLAHATAAGLPHGTRRRVDIARALATAPRLIILDEPAAGLTQADAGHIADLLRQAAATGTAILIIEHDMKFLLPL